MFGRVWREWGEWVRLQLVLAGGRPEPTRAAPSGWSGHPLETPTARRYRERWRPRREARRS